ncbi:uncharacterized protein LOC106090773 [Stomoxys calcitrans]|uniref:uncharacterized protein LOC106090773 n=1 Tax=Stomoxys calcitrans TaxID=35570 RepID=UPI0027E25C25|nr:uncharacterized protein LOC106090773 [Stomoxys calcitrans]
MDSDIGDMFTILSFLKLCKMYKKLKRRKPLVKKHAASRYKYPNRIPLLSLQKMRPTQQKFSEPIQHDSKESMEENLEAYTVIPDDQIEVYDEYIETKANDEDNHVQYHENDELMSTIVEEKPKIIMEAIPQEEAYTDQNYQYEISFEVNGERRHVVLGNGAVDTECETKYESQEIDENAICYDICADEQEVLVESTEEIQAVEVCPDEEQEEFCYEVNAEEIEEEYQVQEEQVQEYQVQEDHMQEDQVQEVQVHEVQVQEVQVQEIQVQEVHVEEDQVQEVHVEEDQVQEEHLQDPPKKRRRRRRRGDNAELDEENEVKEKKPRTRSFKVRPENLNRHQDGFFGRVFLDVKVHNEEQFILLTRMKRNAFEKLLKLMFKAMSKRAQHIYPEERLSVTLLYLAHATPFDVIAKHYKLGKTTIRNLVLETCEILYEILGPIYLREPTSEDFLKIAQDFRNTWKLPNCVGVIDGKHINLKKPRRTLLEEYNLTAMTSLVLMAACDAKHRFRSATVTVEAHQSTFAKGIMNNTLPLPPNAPLVDGSSNEFPYYYIGDTTFPLRSNLMRPYDTSTLDDKKLVFNYKLSHGQAILENTFIMLTSMWKVLLTTFDIAPLNCESIIMACIVLHNFVMMNGEDRWHNSDGTLNAELPHNYDENTDWISVETSQFQTALESITKFGGECNGTGNELRDTLAEHFYQDGSVEASAVIFEM